MYKCSVITSIYNAEKFIKGFLDNVLEQEELENYEILLLDAQSTDRTEEHILSYDLPKNIIYKKLDKKYSIYETWNIGVDLASSDVITNWNTDDRKKHNSLKTQSNFMINNPDCDISYCYLAWSLKENEKFNENNLLKIYPCGYPSYEYIVTHNSPHCMPFWRKKLHKELGYFDTSYKTAADHDFWCRCFANNKKFEMIPSVLGLYYHNPQGLSTNAQTTNMEEGREIRKKYEKIN